MAAEVRHSPTPARIDCTAYASFDEIAAASNGNEIFRRGTGSYKATLISAELGPVALMWTSHTAPMIGHARIGSDDRLFVMHPGHEASVFVNGHTLDETRLIDQRPGTHIHVATGLDAGCVQLIAIRVDPRELDRVSMTLTGQPFSSGPSLCTLVQPEQRALASLRRLCTDTLATCALAAAEDPETIFGDGHGPALAEAVLSALVEVVGSDLHCREGHELNRDFEARLVGRALGFLGVSGEDPAPLARLCTVAGASERQLQRAFHSVYGIGPKRYLRLRRLHRVRAALLEAGPGATVASVASSFGFSDLGRFASAYRALFDEAPSTTLASCPRITTASNASTCRDLRNPSPVDRTMTPISDRDEVAEVIDARPASEAGTARPPRAN
jgi:AraC family ethanolamine operon transcriptional activator